MRGVVSNGANTVSGLSFDIDDRTKLENEAHPEEYLARAAAEGMLRLPQPGAKLDLKTKPAVHKGRSASEILIEDRR